MADLSKLLGTNDEEWTPIEKVPITNEEKKKLVERQNDLKKSMKSLDGKMDRLEQKIEDFKSTVNSIKEGDCAKWVEESKHMVKTLINDNARCVLGNALTEMRTEAWNLKNEIEKRERKLETLDPTSKYYSAIVGGVLDAVKERGFELTSQNATDIVCKALEVSGYQKWQEIKGENWGKNETSKPKMKII